MKKIIILILGILLSLIFTSCKINAKSKNKTPYYFFDDFFEALSLNDRYSAEQLLKSNDINAKDKYGVTLLMKACGAMEYSNISEDLYDYDCAVLLIENGADVTLTDNKGFSALDYAVKYAQSKFCANELIDILIEKGASFNVKKANETLSGYDNSYYDYSIVKKLADKFDFSKAVPKQVWNSIRNESLDFNECASLSEADKIKVLFNICAYSNKLQIQKYLKEIGISINVKDDYGNYPLHACAMTGNIETFNYLLDNSIIPNKADSKYTVFQYAALTKHFQICLKWVDKKLPLSERDFTALYFCKDKSLLNKAFKIVNPETDVLKKMLVNADKYSTTEYLDTIVNHGISIDCIYDDFTLLERTAYLGYENLVEYALNKGADPDGTALRYSPIFYAVSNNNIEIVKLLIDKKANISSCVEYDDGSQQDSPLEIAKGNNNKSIIQILKNNL